MVDLKGFQWYSKYIADIASDGGYPGSDASSALRSTLDNFPQFQLYNSPISGRVVVVNSSVAPIFLAAITLVTSAAVPLLFVRIARSAAVAWKWSKSRRPQTSPSVEGAISQGNEKTPLSQEHEVQDSGHWIPITHLPVLLANSGSWLEDAWCSLNLSIRELRRSRTLQALAYLTFFILAAVALVAGPLAALLLSREVMSGFSGALEGPCIHQNNFSDNAANAFTNRSDHHGRAMELLPFLRSFSYSWSELGAQKYTEGSPVVDSISNVQYTREEGCLLNDPALCDPRFPYTHRVVAELTPSQMGIWSSDNWRFRMEGYCLKLQSSAMMSIYDENGEDDQFYIYSLEYAENAVSLTPDGTYEEDLPLGQFDFQRYARRKNVITDSYFVNNEAQVGWRNKKWPPSIRALDVDAIAILTVLPTTSDAVNQSPDDELFLRPANTSSYIFQSDNIAHMLCWERLTVVAHGRESARNQSWAAWSHRDRFLRENNLDRQINPLIQFAATEFITKPLRFLRGNTLLASVAETPRWEINASFAAPVPFGAEMHRWGHIGLMDIASKAARITSGYYARGLAQNETTLAAIHSPQLLDLCASVRATQEGALSIPLWIPIFCFVLLIIALVWWALEVLLVMLASAGYAGVAGCLRSFLILPATTPTALNTSIAIASAHGVCDTVRESVSGWPDASLPTDKALGLKYIEQEDGQIVVWGPRNESRSRKLNII